MCQGWTMVANRDLICTPGERSWERAETEDQKMCDERWLKDAFRSFYNCTYITYVRLV